MQEAIEYFAKRPWITRQGIMQLADAFWSHLHNNSDVHKHAWADGFREGAYIYARTQSA